MKLHLGVVGKLKDAYLVAASDEYLKRLRPMCTLSVHEAKDEAGLLAALPASCHLYAFDERGEMITSQQLADMIATEQSHGGGAPVAFVIGGADGHSEAVRKRARKLIAFGRMTIAHRLVRILVLEQIYRAFKIVRGEPYHRD
ncbi:MAG TPA: 23S rRNA (pseudouridine(1915)-N(3))-methyltransferase RlmH [Kofleriaceae bacterium]